MKKTLEGRKVGILYTDGSEGAEIEALQNAIRKGGGTAFLISPKVGGAKLNDGTVAQGGWSARGLTFTII